MNATLAGELLLAARENPERRWLRFCDGESYTYAGFCTRVTRIAANLLGRGISPGERLVTFVDNRFEFLAVWFAAHLAGVVVVPVNTALRGDVLGHVMTETEPRLVLVEGRYHRALAEHLSELAIRPTVVVVGEDAGPPSAEAVPFEALQRVGAAPPTRWPGTDGSDPGRTCCIMYTSGTTGRSKGACYSNGYHLRMGVVGRDNMQYGADDVLYTCLPLFHGNALNTSVTPALLGRSGLAIGSRFSASRFWTEVSDTGATAVNLLGAMTPILLKRPPTAAERQHSVRRALVIPAPPEYHDLLPRRFGLKPIEAYGLSDGAMVLWCPPGSDSPPGSCGVPTDGYQVALVDEMDEQIEGAGSGELVFRPTNPWSMALGYWRQPEATNSAWRNLWFHTGDVLRRDEEGWYYFVDRAKDVIRRRGENVSAFEVETTARTLPGVVDCAAYAVPSELSEDEVALALVVSADWSLTEADVIEYLRPRLPYFAVPRFLRYLQALPMTETQKVRKQVLRDEGTGDAWDRDAAGIVIGRAG